METYGGADLKGPLRLLRAAAFLSNFDRFTVAPMLLTIAADLRVSLAEVAAVASLYYLLYGLMQPVWGMLSDRLGRVRVMWLTLLAVVVPGLLSALAPTLAVLVVGRALAGGLFSAVIPAALVYIGDTVPISFRQKALADQLAAGAVAIALATAAAGLAAQLGLWRFAFAAPALASGALSLLLARRLPEPGREGGGPGPIAPVGLYGLAMLVWTQALKRVADRLDRYALILIGGALLTLGYAAGALDRNLLGTALAAVLVGGGFAFMHSTLQTWATQVVPEARASVISFFAAALFAGSGIATIAVAPLAEAHSYRLLFAVAALIAVPLGILGGLARLHYDRK